jgi:hypothetical protein
MLVVRIYLDDFETPSLGESHGTRPQKLFGSSNLVEGVMESGIDTVGILGHLMVSSFVEGKEREIFSCL